MAIKVYIENNYFYLEADDGSLYEGHAKDVLVTALREDSTDFYFKGLNGWKEKTKVKLSDITDRAGVLFTLANFKTFYNSSTGSGSGGSSAVGAGTASAVNQQATNAKLDTLIAENDDPGIIALLNDLKTTDATDSVAIANILTQLQATGVDTKDIETAIMADASAQAIANADISAKVLETTQEVAKIDVKTPTPGQKTKAGSVPVTLASDEDAIAIESVNTNVNITQPASNGTLTPTANTIGYSIVVSGTGATINGINWDNLPPFTTPPNFTGTVTYTLPTSTGGRIVIVETIKS